MSQGVICVALNGKNCKMESNLNSNSVVTGSTAGLLFLNCMIPKCGYFALQSKNLSQHSSVALQITKRETEAQQN